MNHSLEDVPIEIEDEFKLGLEAGVEDESAEESTSASFSITSYGADYPVDTLVKRMKGEAFFIPKFQRNFVWSQRHASRFIESLLMGLPVPGIFLYKEAETGRHLVVDGQQRLRTLQYFYSGLFLEKAFRLIGVRQEWEGKTYEDLASNEQLKLDDAIVHATVFQQDEPKDSLRSLYFVFERINSGGIRLSPQEIRNCISEGAVLDVVRVLNDDVNWRAIFGAKRNNRLKDQELVLRALAMVHNRANYSAPMRDFLNDFASDEEKEMNPTTLEELKKLFEVSMEVINKAKGKSAFRPVRALNAAVFEAVIVGIAERIRAGKSYPDLAKVETEYDKLLLNAEFLKASTSATATGEAVKTRQRLAVEAFVST
jgi:Mor family transcriptional regulator